MANNINICNHPKEYHTIVVVGGFAMHEIIRIKCTKCNEFISKEINND
ncbi:MAG: hypothetical protein KGV59_07590 [Tenacibaculum sp.]|nr:hypothetical protein [Tenacibaculum sp.]